MFSFTTKPKYSADELFFEELYKGYFMKAVYYANQYVSDIELAKEIAQDSFIILWEKRNDLDFNLNIGAYLMSIVRNRCLNTLRNRSSKIKKVDPAASIELMISHSTLMDESASKVISGELTEIINKTFDSLPEKIRSVFVMNRDQKLTYPQIAKILNISDKTVEYRMSKALAIFRITLKDFLPSIFFLL